MQHTGGYFGPAFRQPLSSRSVWPWSCRECAADACGSIRGKLDAAKLLCGARLQSRCAGALLGTWMEDTGGKSGRRPARHLQVEASGPAKAVSVQRRLAGRFRSRGLRADSGALEMVSHRGHTALVSTLTTLVEAPEKSASEVEQAGGTQPERAGCTDEAEEFWSAEEDEPVAS